MLTLEDRRSIQVQKAAALREKLVRRERETQSCRGGLYEFVKYFWHVLEPKTVFVDGWAMRAICDHLEAVTFGEITRLLINVPPGFSKSLLVNVFWPAWEWGPMNLPHLRTISFSYAAHLTERDNGRFRDLVTSRSYKELWGERFSPTGVGVVKVANDKTGWRFASSVLGVGTGERADRCCFPPDEVVLTERGSMRIKDVVDRRLGLRVWSTNIDTGETSLKRVVGWHRNPSSDIVEVRTSRGAVRCTPDHRLWTQRGWVVASELRSGDVLPCLPFSDVVDRVPRDVETLGERRGTFAGCQDVAHVGLVEDGVAALRSASHALWIGLVGMLASGSPVRAAQVKFEMSPLAAGSYAGDGGWRNAELLSKGGGRCCVPGRDGANQVFGQMARPVFKSSVPLAIRNVLRSGSIFKVFKSSVSSVAVLVTHLGALWAGTYKRSGDELMDKDVPRLAVGAHRDARVSLIKNSRHEPTGNSHDCSGAYHCARNADDAPRVGNAIAGKSDGVTPDFANVIGVDFVGHSSVTYCLTIEDNHTMYCGSSPVLASNCLDDPHNIADGESDVKRAKAVRWFDEAMSNRLNDLQKSAIVVIMQRVNEADVSGHIIDKEDYCHLLIPMELDGYRPPTQIGWVDPRKYAGELAWPERFSDEALTRFRANPFMWASQYQQTPEPRGGGLFKRDWWRRYELPRGKQPPAFDYIVASLDSAYTKQERNDPSGFTAWGVFKDRNGNPVIMLLQAWRKHLEIHGPEVERLPGEHELDYVRRAKQSWGLVEWVAYECKRLRVHNLIIEAKASGLSVAQEMTRLYGTKGWGVTLENPEGDKYARGIAIVHLLADGLVHVPAELDDPNDPDSDLVPRDFAQLMIDDAAMFPNGRFRDVVDSMTQALKHLRAMGLAVRREEREEERLMKSMNYEQARPLYDV